MRISRRSWLLPAAVLLVGCGRDVRTAPLGAGYPPTRTVSVVDDYHGTRVADPYRWLEDVGSEEVRGWAAAQTAFAEPKLRNNAVRPWLVSRMNTLAEAWDQMEAATSTAVREAAFQLTPVPGQSHRVLTVAKTGGARRVLVDPKSHGAGMEIPWFHASPDGRLVAYALSDGGSDWVQTRVRRVDDGIDLPEALADMLFSEVVWTHDSQGLFYVRSQRPGPGEHTALRSPAVFYHRVGTPQSSDRPILRTPEGTTDTVIVVELTPDGRYLLIYEGSGAYGAGSIGWLLSRMHLVDLGRADRPDVSRPAVALTPGRDAAYRVIGSAGHELLLFTDHGAPRRRLVAIDPKRPDPARWRDVIPEGPDVIDSIREINGRFVVVYLRDVQHRIAVFERDGTGRRDLALPPLTTVLSIDAGPTKSEIVTETMSFFQPPTRTRHNLESGAQTVERGAAPALAAGQYEARQVWYPSRDGTRIPMFLLHRTNNVRDGSHPVLLYGYGASSQVMGPSFGENAIAWLELGGIFAVPALRGGGEFGRTWYEAGTLARKQNTFDDFIAAAEYLVAERYTSAAKLAISGASNGGLLVAATMTQRPDLFAVAIAEVPMTDALRYDRGRHTPQFGSPKNPEHFPFLHAYSPVHRVRPGTCYPATLITTALNDDRAPAWQAMKFAAALQAAQSCDRPILLRAATTGGHGGDDFIEDAADALAFAAQQFGMAPPVARGK